VRVKNNPVSKAFTAGLLMMSLLGGQTVHAQKELTENEQWAAIKTFGFKDIDQMMRAECGKSLEKYANCVNALAALYTSDDQFITTAAEMRDYQIKAKKVIFTAGDLQLIERDGDGKVPAKFKNLNSKQLNHALTEDHKKYLQETAQSSVGRLPSMMNFIRQQALKAGEPEAKQAAYYISAFYQNSDAYFNLSLTEQNNERIKGEAQDVTMYGIYLDSKIQNAAIVVGLVEDSPAKKAGLRQGDRIISVNGISTADKSPDDVLSMFGKKSSTLEVRRKGKKLSIKITKAEVKQENVTAHIVQEQGRNYLAIKFDSFMDKNACNKISDVIESNQRRSNLSGIILDLRNNGGGLLDQSVCIASLFLPGDQVVTSVKYLNGNPTDFLTTWDDATMSDYQLNRTNLPLVLLTNAGSASASEVLSGALRDYKRAWIIGDRTFGKGTVMNMVQMPSTPEIMLTQTIAVFHQPDGTTNQLVGILPDFKVNSRPGVPDSDEDSFRNEDLEGKLASAENKTVQSKRIREVVKVNQCLDYKAITAKYNEMYGSATQPDYRMMFATEVLRCSGN
jgi:Periplasmic protease